MDLLRERELKDSVERQLFDEQKFRGLIQKRLRKERRARRGVHDKLEFEIKRRIQLEEALKNNGGADQLRIINESMAEAELQLTLSKQQHPHPIPPPNYSQPSTSNIPQPPTARQSTPVIPDHPTNQSQQDDRCLTPTHGSPSMMVPPTQSAQALMTPAALQGAAGGGGGGVPHAGPTVSFRADLMPPCKEQSQQRHHQGEQHQQQQQQQQQQQHPGGMQQMGASQSGNDVKPWGYSGLDLINSSAAFWQNYSDSLAQELEMERKSRQQPAERDVKSPIQDRSGYYKNSVLFTSSAT